MTRRKDGLWQQQMTVMVDGRKKQKCFYGKTKAEVLRKIAAYEEEKERGVLFEKVADEWWEKHEPTLAFNTAKSYKPAKIRAVERFKGREIKGITPTEISAHIEDFGRTHAKKTIKTQLLIYNLIGQYAVKHGYCLANPARDLSVGGNTRRRKITSPTSEDIDRVKKSTGCTFGLFAYWAMYTGMRRGELLALTWEDVDLEAKTISINKSLYHINNRPQVKLPKTEASLATVPILNALMKVIPDKKPSGLVFQNESGTHITETQFHSLWVKYCKESGVTATPHQFRHAFATMLFEANIPPEEMQILLRHAQLSTTMDVYRDIRDRKIKQVHDKVYEVDIQ